MGHGSLEEDLIAWNWMVAYAVEPKGYRHLVIIYRALLSVGMDHHRKPTPSNKVYQLAVVGRSKDACDIGTLLGTSKELLQVNIAKRMYWWFLLLGEAKQIQWFCGTPITTTV
jgi:hypothetical protein